MTTARNLWIRKDSCLWLPFWVFPICPLIPTSAACQAVAGVCKSILVRSIWPNIFISFKSIWQYFYIHVFTMVSPQLKHNEEICVYVLQVDFVTNSVPCYFSLKSQVFFFLSLVYSSNIRVFWRENVSPRKLWRWVLTQSYTVSPHVFFFLAGLIVVYFKHGWSVVHCSNFALKMKLL